MWVLVVLFRGVTQSTKVLFSQCLVPQNRINFSILCLNVVVMNFVTDVNECEDSLHDCDVNAKCTNAIGAFVCTCLDGFSGDGKTCTGMTMPLFYQTFHSITSLCIMIPSVYSMHISYGLKEKYFLHR